MANAKWEVIDTIRDPDGQGLVATITARDRNGYRALSFTFHKEFERNGVLDRTSYLSERHLPALRNLIDEVEASLETERDRIHAGRRSKARRA